MQRLRIDQDIRPLSEFRAGVATFFKQIQETKRPLVITQHDWMLQFLSLVLAVLSFEAIITFPSSSA